LCQSRNYPLPQSALDIDWEHLQHISDSNSDFAFDLLALLAQDFRAKVISLREAVRTDDMSALRELTHYLKGAAANMGVKTIVAIAQQLEGQKLPCDRAMINILLTRLDAALCALEALVQQEM
jgi:HPt (histidine-containing phosphotransfer) domain-containing protein